LGDQRPIEQPISAYSRLLFDLRRQSLAEIQFPQLDCLNRRAFFPTSSASPFCPNPPVDALTKYEELDGAEATAFFKANRAAIIASQNRRQYGNQK
jgi:hypothetical protein